jgi:radical SAM superfamily enzyme YgiQ (UPF0313 family)
MNKKKKILLIYPVSNATNYSDMGYEVVFLTKKPGGLLNAGLATIAALTPPGFEVKIIDENVETIDFDEPCDLVGITGFLTQFYRAEEIAAEFSRRGIPVVCGGPSVSLSPERWKPFADVLIIGEAEQTWPRFLNDYLAGSYQPEYRENERFDLTISPVPDYSNYSRKSLRKFLGGIVQTSRGCPFNCEYCDVIHFMGRKKRYKPIDKILQELQSLYDMGQNKSIFLADDNFSADPVKAKEILAAIRDWNREQRRPVPLISMVSIEIARDEEFLELAAESGLTRIFIGIETSNVESLKETGKLQNTRTDMLEDVKRFYRHGILLLAGCMVGFDHDDLSIFQQQFDFFMQSGIPGIHVLPVQAADGSRLKERMIREGRYIDWEGPGRTNPYGINELNTLTLIPRRMTLQQLTQGTQWLLWQLYKPENFLERYRYFLDCYEQSPKKNKLEIPKIFPDREGFGIVGRVIKYLLTRSTKAERRTFRQMFQYTRRSSHPQRLGFLIETFLTLKNTHMILTKVCPGIEHVTYPQ